MSAKPIPKYRLSLTTDQILYLQQLLQTDTSEQYSKVRKLTAHQINVFILKMKVGLVSAAYTSSLKISIEDSLGLDDTSDSADSVRLAAYKKYSSHPELCSSNEILQARTYMYENDMMSDEEAAAFESE